MSDQNRHATLTPASKVSLDTWAVLLALLAATLIRLGIIPRVPW